MVFYYPDVLVVFLLLPACLAGEPAVAVTPSDVLLGSYVHQSEVFCLVAPLIEVHVANGAFVDLNVVKFRIILSFDV